MTNHNTGSRLTHLGDVSIETFLKEYWQKKPLLVRNAFPNFKSPITADELAGLCLDADVTSRLVVENGLDGKTPWQVSHGPLPEAIFQALPETHWTLLVQHADLLDPDITELLNPFRFIPNWRLDDIMVSYAANQGSVGPHFDYYDVFLLQAEGTRRWQLGQQCDAQSPLVPGLSMQVLTEFDCQKDWVVEPGDLLYIPPGMAHWGVAQSECITYSFGFRAPSHGDIMLDYFTERASETSEDHRYCDPQLTPQQHSGEISHSAIAELSSILQRYANDNEALSRWFGEFMTRPNPGGEHSLLQPISVEDILSGRRFRLSPSIRTAYYSTDTQALLFVNSNSWTCSQTFATKISDYRFLTLSDVSQDEHSIITLFAENEWLVGE